MRTLSLLIFLIFTKLFIGQNSNYDLTLTIAQQERKAYQARINGGGSAAKNNYDYVYARCNWNINPAERYISGNVLCLFKPTVTGFKSIEFDLSND